MTKNVWLLIVAAVDRAHRLVQRTGRVCQYSDSLIVKLYLYAVLHDRPLCWACDRENFKGCFRPRCLPSVSQFCRRMKTPRVDAMLDHVHQQLASHDRPIDIVSVDGKALPISDYTTDADAKTGHGCGRFQRGYKLHACVADDDRIPCFQVHSMNVAEQTVAFALLPDAVKPGMLLLGDSNYDSSRLYQRCADQHAMMLTPLKGHSRDERRRRRMPAARLDALMLWEQRPGIAKSLLRQRDRIERVFAALTGVGFGLKGLPAWVRRLDRVRHWVAGKIILYHAHLKEKEQAA